MRHHYTVYNRIVKCRNRGAPSYIHIIYSAMYECERTRCLSTGRFVCTRWPAGEYDVTKACVTQREACTSVCIIYYNIIARRCENGIIKDPTTRLIDRAFRNYSFVIDVALLRVETCSNTAV